MENFASLAIVLFFCPYVVYSSTYEQCRNQVNRGNVVILSCYRLKLKEIPAEPPKDAIKYTNLVFAENNLSYIPKGPLDTFSNLTTLYFEYNQITEVAPAAFENMHQLVYIALSFNKIFTLQEGTFKGLSSLVFLLLDHNQLTVIRDDAFKGAPVVEALTLGHNALTSISERAVAYLRYLRDFEIKNQRSKKQLTLKLGLIQSFLDPLQPEKYHLIELKNNDFDCTCEMDWLVHYMNRQVLPDGRKVPGFQNIKDAKNVLCRGYDIRSPLFARDFMRNCCLEALERGDDTIDCDF